MFDNCNYRGFHKNKKISEKNHFLRKHDYNKANLVK